MNTPRQPPPNSVGKPRADLVQDDFDLIVYQKGLDVTWESAMPCPCKMDGRGFLPDCINCGGSGWIFIDPVQTKMVIQSMNLNTKYVEWSVEKLGTATITARYADILAEMDRITLNNSVSKMSQIIRPKLFDDGLFSFLNYEVINVMDVMMFVGQKVALTKLSVKDYQVDGNKIHINKSLYTEDLTLSVRYTHRVQYHIIDITREMRMSKEAVAGKRDINSQFPVSAVGRRCHFVLRPNDYYNPATGVLE